jgi:hypothetical protein
MRELVAVLFLVFVEQSLFCLQNFAFKSGRALIMKRLDVIFSSYKPNSSYKVTQLAIKGFVNYRSN